jgi:hypothetical protein
MQRGGGFGGGFGGPRGGGYGGGGGGGGFGGGAPGGGGAAGNQLYISNVCPPLSTFDTLWITSNMVLAASIHRWLARSERSVPPS